jgi:hypothetical protein
MADLGTIANPFATWAVLTTGLRDRFVAELPEGSKPYSVLTGEFLGSLAEMIRRCEVIGTRLSQLERNEPEVFEAFLRALENS